MRPALVTGVDDVVGPSKLRAMRRALAVLALAACSAPAVRARPTPTPAVAPPSPATPSPDAGPPVADVELPAGMPDTVAGRHAAWVLEVVAQGGKTDRATIEARFAPAFLAKVPADKLVTMFPQLAAQLGNAQLVETKQDGDTLIVRLATLAGAMRFLVKTQADDKIVGLLFQPDSSHEPKTFDEAIAMADKLAPRTQLLVASLDRGKCTPVHERSTKGVLAIGSTFKLYVLLALADRVLAGKVRWEDEIAIRDDWKSLPSGITQNEADGTKLTVRALAERMISISDNTATDHLLYTLGRSRVEDAVKAAKHGGAAHNRPFLATREMFLIKLGMSAPETEAYIAKPERDRRAALDAMAGKRPTLDGVADWTTARFIDQVEWFASTTDLCNVMATLVTRSGKPAAAPVLEVMGMNPLVDKGSTWSYIGYKGGSEPGVINMTWVLRRADHKWFVVAVTLNGSDPIDTSKVLGIGKGLLALAAKAK